MLLRFFEEKKCQFCDSESWAKVALLSRSALLSKGVDPDLVDWVRPISVIFACPDLIVGTSGGEKGWI